MDKFWDDVIQYVEDTLILRSDEEKIISMPKQMSVEVCLGMYGLCMNKQ